MICYISIRLLMTLWRPNRKTITIVCGQSHHGEDTGGVEYVKEGAGTSAAEAGKRKLKIVSMWQRMIEFPGLRKFTLIIQEYPSVSLPRTHSFVWKCE